MPFRPLWKISTKYLLAANNLIRYIYTQLLKDMKYNQLTLNKIEKMLGEAGYVLRYERGTFQSGYCVLEDKKVVVLNKFLQLEGRLNTLLDLQSQLNIDVEELSPESRTLHEQMKLELIGKESS